MSKFLFYLTSSSIIEASITERTDAVFVGELEITADLLYPIMQLMQNSCDAISYQLVDKMMTYEPDDANGEAWEEGLEELNRRLCNCEEAWQTHLPECPLSNKKNWN